MGDIMKKSGSILRIAIAGILFIATFCSDIISAMPQAKTDGEKQIVLASDESEIKEESPATEITPTESAAVAVQAAEAKGRIINRFISPYTANTAYNNVYLKNNTDLSINIKSLLESDLPYKLDKSGDPQVLILHTHATECFMNEERDYYTDADATRSDDNALNTVALGNIITEKLNAAGIVTLHSDVQHDNPDYNQSYSKAARTICSYLEKYPSIKIVIDLHRDSVSGSDGDKYKLTTEINGKKAAQVMLVMGSQSGNVKNFPNYEQNLKLAVRLQQTVEVMYPTLARALCLNPKNYNESLTTGSILLEVGTEANTLEEVKYSAELMGNALVSLLNTLN